MAVILAMAVILLASVSTVKSECKVTPGRIIQSGDIFEFKHEPCVVYKCTGQQYKVHEAKCEHDGKCIEMRGLSVNDKCEVFECKERVTPNGKIIGMVKTEVRCKVGDKCYSDGDEFFKNPGDKTKCKCTVPEGEMKFDVVCP
ncbi:hypothetical protein SNE40_019520 [Patella caerulea]|uniref:Uncharacterized protein n=1 Tax=Patella caerulea TaxID=87958 RepID=A0AAN8J6M2_PATCE